MRSASGLRRKVALVADSRAHNTGIGRYVQMLHSGLGESGVDVLQVTPTVPSLPNVSYWLLRLLGRDLRAFLTNYPLWSAYPRADVYHLTNQVLATLLLFCKPKGRVVITVHDIFPHMLRSDPHLRSPYGAEHLFHGLAMAGLRHADHLVTVSEYTKQCVVAHLGLPPEKISVVYSGVDHQRFRRLPVPADVRERYKLPEGHRYLLYVGSEDPRKNLVTVVRALAEVRREQPDVELVKVGLSHFDQERQRLIELATTLGIRTAIHFLEDLPESDLPLLYSLADVYVTPSPYEGFGFPVVEAMACGTPVVYANAGSLPEIVGSAGVPVAVRDVDAWAGTLVSVLGNTDRRMALRHAGYSRAAKFTWTATIEGTAAVYEKLIRNGFEVRQPRIPPPQNKVGRPSARLGQ
jgi:glycosyltransferase involved in cell wall biosynthesis